MTEFQPGPCPACGDQIQDAEHAARHYLTGCKTKVFCENCGVPIPFEKLQVHPNACIGQTQWVLHNRKAGMIVYLSEEEWVSMQAGTLSTEQAAEVVARAVFGVEFETVDLGQEKA